MRLNRAQLDAGSKAVASFLEPAYAGLSPYSSFMVRDRALNWLMPILLMLPDGVDSELLDGVLFDDEFLLAAEHFMLVSARRDEANDRYSDGEILRRLEDGKVAQSAVYLRTLTITFLQAAEKTKVTPAPLATLEELLDDGLDPDAALQALSTHNDSHLHE